MANAHYGVWAAWSEKRSKMQVAELGLKGKSDLKGLQLQCQSVCDTLVIIFWSKQIENALNRAIYKLLLQVILISARCIFHAVTPSFPLRHQWDPLVATTLTEDANKPDMLFLKLALNFRATIISFSIFTNVI